jgi:hypothetical protein
MNTKFGLLASAANALPIFINGKLAAAAPAPTRNSRLVSRLSVANQITPLLWTPLTYTDYP